MVEKQLWAMEKSTFVGRRKGVECLSRYVRVGALGGGVQVWLVRRAFVCG